MMLNSVLAGISVVLLIPLLNLLNLTGTLSNSSVISSIAKPLQQLPSSAQLPAVLALYVVLLITQATLERFISQRNIQMEQRFIRHIRTDMYEAMLEANWPFFLRKRKSDLTNIMTTELPRVSYGIFTSLQLVMNLVYTVVQIGLAIWLSYQLTALVLICGLLLVFVTRKFVFASRSLGDEMTSLMQTYMAGMTEHFNGIKDIKSNRTEQQHALWFRNLTKQMERNVVHFSRVQSISQYYYKVAAGVFIVLFVYIATAFVHVQPSMLLLIVVIFSRLWPKFASLQAGWENIAQILPACKALLDLHTESEQAREFNLKQLSVDIDSKWRMWHGIECRDISYQYDTRFATYALRHIHLHIQANSMVAIVGKSGAGKSTLIDLLIGLIEPQQGEILIDGVPIQHCAAQFRRMVSYVSQDPFLFHLTLRENLRMGAPDASEEKLWEALRFSAAHEFVKKLPQGLDTVIGDRGVRLSGGERQRIVLARAILRNPSVLILDEATSALDSENEVHIQQALERIRGTMTIIVIAHRLSTIRNADQVIVLDQGTIVQQGSYQQLAQASDGLFSHLLKHQELEVVHH
ncbi:ABC transporter ATP-binding protein [Paenibacillus cellulosilyticus]|nr:ABC transporter ATP-binding protein [Paenibacillus cellulosilyticus]